MSKIPRLRAWETAYSAVCESATLNGDAVVWLNGSAELAAQAMALPQELVDAAEAEILAADEAARQAAKSLELKTIENEFLLLCETLCGQKIALTPVQLDAYVSAIPDQAQKLAVGLRLVSMAEVARSTGARDSVNPWNDVVWHSEIVEG